MVNVYHRTTLIRDEIPYSCQQCWEFPCGVFLFLGGGVILLIRCILKKQKNVGNGKPEPRIVFHMIKKMENLKTQAPNDSTWRCRNKQASESHHKHPDYKKDHRMNQKTFLIWGWSPRPPPDCCISQLGAPPPDPLLIV